MTVRDRGNLRNINHVGIWIAQSLNKDRFCVFLYGILKSALFLRIHKGSGDLICQRQGVGKQIVSPAVDRPCRYNVLSCFGKRLERIA